MIKRGEIYLVNLNPIKGREQAGRRPVLVISSDAINKQPLVVSVVVGTDARKVLKDYPTTYECHQLRRALPKIQYFSVSKCAPWTPKDFGAWF